MWPNDFEPIEQAHHFIDLIGAIPNVIVCEDDFFLCDRRDARMDAVHLVVEVAVTAVNGYVSAYRMQKCVMFCKNFRRRTIDHDDLAISSR